MTEYKCKCEYSYQAGLLSIHVRQFKHVKVQSTHSSFHMKE